MPSNAAELVTDLVKYAKTKGLQPSDAEDVAQEVAARLLAQPEPMPREQQRAWGFRVAQRLMVDRFRTKESRQKFLASVGPLLEEAVPDIAERAAYIESILLATRALEALSEREQDIIRLLEMEQRPSFEVAEALGLKPTALRKAHQRARVALRKEYVSAGGTVAGLAFLFPTLRSAHRLHVAATSGLVVPSLVAASLMFGISVAPWAGAQRQPRAPYETFGSIDDSDSAKDTLSAIRGSQANRHLPVHGGRRPAKRGSVGKSKSELIRECSDVDQDPTWVVAVCKNQTADPNVYAYGVTPPGALAPYGVVVSTTDGDLTPVCPIVTTVPYTVCQKGY